MIRTLIFFSILLKEGVWARAYLNDLPLYTSEIGPNSLSGPINDLLVPGENELTIELLHVPKPFHSPTLDGGVEVLLYEITNPNTTPLGKRVVHQARFPDFWEQVPAERRRFPYFHRSFFLPGVDIHAGPWLAAPPAEFGCDGTPELCDAVRRLHAAVDANDADAFMNEIALKLDHHERAFEGQDRARAAAKRQAFLDDLFAYRLRARPLDMSELHFEARAGGRVAHVTRPAGGHALEAACELEPKRKIRTDLLLTQYAGGWRVFA